MDDKTRASADAFLDATLEVEKHIAWLASLSDEEFILAIHDESEETRTMLLAERFGNNKGD